MLRRFKDKKLEKMWSFFQTYDSYTWWVFYLKNYFNFRVAFFVFCLFQWMFCFIVRKFETNALKNKTYSLLEVKKCWILQLFFSVFGRFFVFNYSSQKLLIFNRQAEDLALVYFHFSNVLLCCVYFLRSFWLVLLIQKPI